MKTTTLALNSEIAGLLGVGIIGLCPHGCLPTLLPPFFVPSMNRVRGLYSFLESDPSSSSFSLRLRRRTLADIIMEKLTEKQTEVETVMSEVSGFPMPQLDPRVLEVYRGVREVRALRACVVGCPNRRAVTHDT